MWRCQLQTILWNRFYQRTQRVFSKANDEKKKNLANYCPNISTKTIFMNADHSKTNEPDKFVLNLSQRLDLWSLHKHVIFQTFAIYNTWNNITQQCKNNKLKIIASTWRDEFELPDGSYSMSEFKIELSTS